MDQHQPPLPFAQVRTVVSRTQAARFSAYDHHRVRVNGRLGIMLTYHGRAEHNAAEPITLVVALPSEPIALAHPAAPEAIQELIDRLRFT